MKKLLFLFIIVFTQEDIKAMLPVAINISPEHSKAKIYVAYVSIGIKSFKQNLLL